MNKKKIIILIIILLVISGGVFYFFTRQDKTTTLTVMEKQWIENNKNKLIDLQIVNNIPVFTYNGEGVVFDFLDNLGEVTNLEFNKIAYEYGGNVTTEYSIGIVDKKEKNDILIYQDNYVVVSKNKVLYNDLTDLNDLTIGCLDSNLDSVNRYLKGSLVTYKTFSKIDDMFDELKKEDASVDGIVIPKNIYLEDIITNNLYINYNISEMTLDYVLRLGDTERLNNILKKYYQKWKDENLEDSYNNYLSKQYFDFSSIDEKQRADFRSKRYVYGYVNNYPFDAAINGKSYGINSYIIEEFSKVADVEINYSSYKKNSSLIENFNANKVDIIFNNLEVSKFDLDTYDTVSPFSEKLVVVSRHDNNKIVNSINSLIDEKVSVLKNSKIEKYLIENNVDVSSFDTIDDMINKGNMLVIDYDTYNYYLKSKLNGYKIDYMFDLDSDYTYTIRNISDNTLFNNFFDFYLTFYPIKNYINNGYYSLVDAVFEPFNMVNIIVYIVLAIIGILIIFLIFKLFKKNNKKEGLTKEDKIKYIDMLTSLKNRNYLNSQIEKWDESEVYPQSIIIIDLNNVAYINDNYGHQEGDKVIKDAANILIMNQIENTEIIRTNGNEFLIYLVGYDEKQVVTYIRKLAKEFKGLDHGFGAALGYSMINDAIKTIDDAVNEATLDMKNNKEELNN